MIIYCKNQVIKYSNLFNEVTEFSLELLYNMMHNKGMVGLTLDNKVWSAALWSSECQVDKDLNQYIDSLLSGWHLKLLEPTFLQHVPVIFEGMAGTQIMKCRPGMHTSTLIVSTKNKAIENTNNSPKFGYKQATQHSQTLLRH